MTEAKPRFRVIDGKPVEISPSKVDLARKRFGKPFAHEAGSTWTPHETPVLIAWLQTRSKQA